MSNRTEWRRGLGLDNGKRNCCEFVDLLPVAGSPLVRRRPEMMFCRHCGRRYELAIFTDGDGTQDWKYISEDGI